MRAKLVVVGNGMGGFVLVVCVLFMMGVCWAGAGERGFDWIDDDGGGERGRRSSKERKEGVFYFRPRHPLGPSEKG